ncbi:hypothetical protein SO694_00039218 [Aureococcus anophagefferens]|uniref:Tudor domain-containing protein n=1 Tax=Aureococcus anophagefferens TaxID=44056 RepID=A0ABR1FLM9_AURAN
MLQCVGAAAFCRRRASWIVSNEDTPWRQPPAEPCDEVPDVDLGVRATYASDGDRFTKLVNARCDPPTPYPTAYSTGPPPGRDEAAKPFATLDAYLSRGPPAPAPAAAPVWRPRYEKIQIVRDQSPTGPPKKRTPKKKAPSPRAEAPPAPAPPAVPPEEEDVPPEEEDDDVAAPKTRDEVQAEQNTAFWQERMWEALANGRAQRFQGPNASPSPAKGRKKKAASAKTKTPARAEEPEEPELECRPKPKAAADEPAAAADEPAAPVAEEPAVVAESPAAAADEPAAAPDAPAAAPPSAESDALAEVSRELLRSQLAAADAPADDEEATDVAAKAARDVYGAAVDAWKPKGKGSLKKELAEAAKPPTPTHKGRPPNVTARDEAPPSKKRAAPEPAAADYAPGSRVWSDFDPGPDGQEWFAGTVVNVSGKNLTVVWDDGVDLITTRAYVRADRGGLPLGVDVRESTLKLRKPNKEARRKLDYLLPKARTSLLPLKKKRRELL